MEATQETGAVTAELVAVPRKKLKKADILAAKDLAERWVYVDVWDGEVLLIELNADEALEYVRLFSDPVLQMTEGMTWLVRLCLRDPETRERMFVDPEEVKAFKKKNARAFRKLQDECLELCGFSDIAKAAAKNASGEAVSSDSLTASL